MPLTKTQTARILLSSLAPTRLVGGDRDVKRSVQGVDLTLPRRHMLPVYAIVRPGYGQNLVELAAGLAEREPDRTLQMLDIGANIGDSALQVRARTGAKVLCVEADPLWARYLHLNVDAADGIAVEEVLLLPDDTVGGPVVPVRAHGTTRFVAGVAAPDAAPAATALELRKRNPSFDHVRLIKSDTDGLDTVLVPAAARVWADSRPVLFFEFDPILTREAGNDPDRLWRELEDLGYTELAIWDNLGDPLGRLSVGQCREQARSLEPRSVKLGYHFWDVAACRSDDLTARAVLDAAMTQDFQVDPSR